MTRQEQILAASMSHADKAWKGEHEHAAFKTITMADFSAGATWADAHPRWIPVEEELPREQGKYMFRLSNGDMYYETYYPKLKLHGSVTHWMPIVPPQPNKKDEQGWIPAPSGNPA